MLRSPLPQLGMKGDVWQRLVGISNHTQLPRGSIVTIMSNLLARYIMQNVCLVLFTETVHYIINVSTDYDGYTIASFIFVSCIHFCRKQICVNIL